VIVTSRKRARTIWFEDARDASPEMHIGADTRRLRDFGFAVHESELASITATDLRHALIDSHDYSANIVVTDTDPTWLHEDVVPTIGVEFGLLDSELVMFVDVLMDYVDDDQALANLTLRLITPILHRHQATMLAVEHNGSYIGEPPVPTMITIKPAVRGRTLEQLCRMGRDIAAVVDAASGGDFTRRPTLDLLRAGNAAALIGQPESHWLDVKKMLYDVGQLAGKISLAQAAARFANSDGGIVIFGMGTRKAGAGEVIAKLHPVSTDGHTVRRYRQALEQHLYPLPAGLEVEIVAASGGQLLIVHVPPQPEESKPFLVHGAIVDGKTEGAFISIVRRHGDDTIPITAPAVHSAMSMNRILDQLRPRD
jgi:hypothetical protein